MVTSTAYKYTWLLDTLRMSNGLTLEDLKKQYRRSQMYRSLPKEFSERTFHFWRQEIKDTYGIEIYCDRSEHAYVYRIKEDNAKISEWLSSTISVQQTISNNMSIKDRIVLEDVPNCNYLQEVLTAIKQNLCITFTYTDYWGEAKLITIKPFFVKMFRQRWHVIGPVYDEKFNKSLKLRLEPDESATIRSYGMDDRISNLEVTNIEFRYPSMFNPAEFYSENYSTIKLPAEQMKTEAIQILVWAPQNFYLRSVPLHHSQKEVYTCDEEGYSIFQYILQPTLDFEMELRSYGDYVEVLSPSWFRKEMKEEALKVVNAYKGYDRKTLKTPLPPEYEP